MRNPNEETEGAVHRGRVDMDGAKKPANIDEYLEGVPQEMRDALEKLRAVIKKAAPQAVEAIGWGMPMFKLKGNLVGFAAFKEHCSFFPMSTTVMEAFEHELASYDTSKGTIRFKPGKPLPASLVKKLVKERIKENEARAAAKKHK
jgi:uncharacterized protein YdhG (YjbR/CyaY superfamily)